MDNTDKCPKCGGTIRTEYSNRGWKARCSSCGEEVTGRETEELAIQDCIDAANGMFAM